MDVHSSMSHDPAAPMPYQRAWEEAYERIEREHKHLLSDGFVTLLKELMLGVQAVLSNGKSDEYRQLVRDHDYQKLLVELDIPPLTLDNRVFQRFFLGWISVSQYTSSSTMLKSNLVLRSTEADKEDLAYFAEVTMTVGSFTPPKVADTLYLRERF